MTDTAGPFDGAPWAEAQWARHAATWAPSGVYGPPAASTTTGDLPLSVAALSVGLGAGRAWVRGFGFERTGAAVMQAVTANTHASFSRRDRIVLRRNLATHTVTPVLLTGTPAGTPAAPALTQSDAGSWDLPLFSFLVPPSSGTTITDVVDERVWVDPGGGGILTPRFKTFARTPSTGTSAYSWADGTTTLVSGTWSNAPAGDYLIHTEFQVQGSGNIAADMAVSAGGSLLTPASFRADVPSDVAVTHTHVHPLTFAGGNLAVALTHSPSTQGLVVSVFNNATKIVAQYLGLRA